MGFIVPMITGQQGVFLAAGGGKASFISVHDIAGVAAVVFPEKRYGEAFNLELSQYRRRIHLDDEFIIQNIENADWERCPLSKSRCSINRGKG
ncbi:MAG: hypothetical protein WA705_01095 [Candidatus Ozemobacteraceae bacterium]